MNTAAKVTFAPGAPDLREAIGTVVAHHVAENGEPAAGTTVPDLVADELDGLIAGTDGTVRAMCAQVDARQEGGMLDHATAVAYRTLITATDGQLTAALTRF